MRIQTTPRFDREYARLPQHIKERADKQLERLLSDSHHPSLRIEKAEGYPEVWKGRITQGYRFTFLILGDAYVLRRIGTHDILRKP